MTARLPRLPFLRTGWIFLAVGFVVPVVAALVLGGIVAAAGCGDAAHPPTAAHSVCAAGGGVAPGFVAAWAAALITVLAVGVVAAVVCAILALRSRGELPWARPAALVAAVVVAAVAGVSFIMESSFPCPAVAEGVGNTTYWL